MTNYTEKIVVCYGKRTSYKNINLWDSNTFKIHRILSDNGFWKEKNA